MTNNDITVDLCTKEHDYFPLEDKQFIVVPPKQFHLSSEPVLLQPVAISLTHFSGVHGTGIQ